MRWARRLALATMVVAVASGCGDDEPEASGPTTRPAADGDDRMVDVDGVSIHLVCMGTGSPTLVVAMGFTAVADDWADRQAVLADSSRTCVYERAGTGESDPGPEPRTAQRQADELSALLAAAAIDTPVVLLGESGGGTTLQAFAQRHPDEVAGLVFLDPRLAEYEEQAERVQTPEERAVIADRIAALPPTLAAEVEAGPAAVAEILAGPPLPDIPVIVLTAGVNEPGRSQGDIDLWLTSHQHLVAGLPQGEQRTVEDSPHVILTGPLLQAVEEVLAAVRR